MDLICTHPPYADIIRYSEDIDGDMSRLGVTPFLTVMEKVAEESYRVLKTGFRLKEIILKEQHNCKATKVWSDRRNKFLLLAHEYIFIFEK